MTQTVIALYDDFGTARSVVEDLVDSGFSRENVSIVANDSSGEYSRYLEDNGMDHHDDVSSGEGAGFGAVVGGLIGLGVALIPGIGPVLAAGPFAAAAMAGLGAAAGAVTGGIVGGLVDLGVPEDEAHHYAEGIRRGGTLVTVVADDTMVNRAQDIMNRHNPIDLEHRSASWREAGWTGYSHTAQPMSATDIQAERTRWTEQPTSQSMQQPSSRTMQGEEHIDIVQEELQIGKREVEAGGVRVRKYVTETPVEEQLNLREEHVRVERHPVNRPASEADFNTFEEGVIEVTERHEEAMVNKTARVIEEIVIGKDVTNRTETIHDTVRRTDVEVENLGTTNTSYGSYETFEPSWRTHYTSNFGSSGYTYDQYSPAYRYGYNLASNNRYSGYDWTRLEPEARNYWEERNPGTWDQFKNAVRQAWSDVTNRR